MTGRDALRSEQETEHRAPVVLVADAALTAVTPVMAHIPGASRVWCCVGAGTSRVKIRKVTKSTRRKTPNALGAGARALASISDRDGAL